MKPDAASAQTTHTPRRSQGARAAIVDAEVLHRGGRSGDAWSSTLSIELASADGKAAWDARATEGSTKPRDDDPAAPSWEMLPIAPQKASAASHCADNRHIAPL